VRVTGRDSFEARKDVLSPSNFSERLNWFQQHSPKDAWILEELKLTGNLQDVIRSIQHGTACAISDGSFKDSRGAAGFTIMCPDTGSHYTGCHTVQGPASANSAYRSELSGILGIQTLARLLCLHFKIDSGGITLACDGLSALEQAFYKGHAVATKKSFDIVHAIRHHLRSSKLLWTSRHVKGHQDELKEWAELTWWEQQNVRMDGLAKDKMQRYWTAPTQHVSEHEGWSLWKGDRKHTCFDQQEIYTLLCKQRVIDHWIRRKRLSAEVVHKIDWDVLAKACVEESPGRVRWVTKHVTGMCGVGKFLERWQHQTHSRCPRCDAENEDHRHVYQCPAPSTKLEWSGAMDDLRQWCESHDTSPDITEVILKGLTAWQTRLPPPPYRGRGALANVYDDQCAIGWGCFLEGSLAKGWLDVQGEHFLTLGSRKTASVWARGLIKQLWKTAFRLWVHRNSWQHSDDNPENQRDMIDVDQQITAAYSMGSASVLAEHQHLFQMALHTRLATTLLEKRKWIEFCELAQAKFNANQRRRHEERRRFRAWATSNRDGRMRNQPTSVHQRRANRTSAKRQQGTESSAAPTPPHKKTKRYLSLSRNGGKRTRPPDSDSG
jgi:hypothetical protein